MVDHLKEELYKLIDKRDKAEAEKLKSHENYLINENQDEELAEYF